MKEAKKDTIKIRTIKRAKKDAWDMFSKYIRLRDCLITTGTRTEGKCYTCGRVKKFKQLQAGHFVPGRGNAVLFDEMGVRSQCLQCNYFRGGEPLLFREHLVKDYGESVVQSLELKRHIVKKYSIMDYDLIYLEYKRRYEKMLEGKQWQDFV